MTLVEPVPFDPVCAFAVMLRSELAAAGRVSGTLIPEEIGMACPATTRLAIELDPVEPWALDVQVEETAPTLRTGRTMLMLRLSTEPELVMDSLALEKFVDEVLALSVPDVRTNGIETGADEALCGGVPDGGSVTDGVGATTLTPESVT